MENENSARLKGLEGNLHVLVLLPSYRNSYKKNICVDMLREGYHKSFREVFALMEQWDALREAARLRSVFWLQKPLEEQLDKLDFLYHCLTRAEEAERKGKWRQGSEEGRLGSVQRSGAFPIVV